MYQSKIPPMPPQQINGFSIYMVGSEEEARRWPVLLNSTVWLMDANQSKFYIKSVDSAGMMSAFRSFSFTEDLPETIQNGGDYVTKEEFNALSEKLEEVIKKLSRKDRTNAQSDSKPV